MKNKAFQELTAEVNAVTEGEPRSWSQVKKKLSDYKSETKKKAMKILRHQKATGGGPPINESLNTAEELLLSTMNPQTYEGIIDDGDTSMSIQEIETVTVSDTDNENWLGESYSSLSI